jgi:hypothetical protein
MEFAPVGTLRAAAALVLALAACGGVAHDAPGTGAASGDNHVAGAGGVPGGNGAGAGGRRTTPNPPAMPGGAGGAGGEQASCDGGLQVLRAVSARAFVVWPEQQRVASRTPAGTIQIDDVSAVAEGGPFRSVAELSIETFGLTKDWNLSALLEYGDGLLVIATDGEQTKIFSWQEGTGAAELAVSAPPQSQLSVADPEAGLVFVAHGALYRVTEHAGTWVVGARIETTGQWRTPLAFDGDDLLVGLEESPRFYDEGGSGGEAGAPSVWSAELERWNSASELVASYPAVGNPRVAIPADGGWLIGETNSFWGSYEAALEWLNPAKDELRTLSHVPVHSSGDGEDGAFGVAVSGSRVFVANCESGLLSGRWQGNAVELSALGKKAEFDDCDPTSVHAIGELLVLGGQQLTFARLCDE